MKISRKVVFIGIVLLQVIFILGLVGFKEATLRFGKEVTLQTVPVDPRDLFRGDFVILSYEISRIGGKVGNVIFYALPVYGDSVYVRLTEKGGVWVASEVASDPRSDWDVFIKGTVTGTGIARLVGGRFNRRWITLSYGIESYFVPEGTGKPIERARDVKAVVSVNGLGDAVLKSLIVDGEPFKLR